MTVVDVWLIFGTVFLAMIGLGVVVGIIGSWIIDRWKP